MFTVIALVGTALISTYIFHKRKHWRRTDAGAESPSTQLSTFNDEGPIPGVHPFMSPGIGKAPYFDKVLVTPPTSNDMTAGAASGSAVINESRDGLASSNPPVPVLSMALSMELHPELGTGGTPPPRADRTNHGHSTIAILLERLNQELARLPPRRDNSNQASEAEEPPEYNEAV